MGNKVKTWTAGETSGGRKSGRAVFDDSGRASWEWQTATGVFQSNVTHEQMQQLEASELSLVESNPPASQGRVWTRDSALSTAAFKRSTVSRPAAAVAQRREYETVLKRLLRRLAG